MYKIYKVKIDGFWQRFQASCSFNENVNIIIGNNGTGKTTFMNILHSILSVDIDGLNNNEFDSVEIKLKRKNQIKTIKVVRKENMDSPYLWVEYHLSRRKYPVRILSSDDKRASIHLRKRTIQESEEVRNELAKLVSLSSLSVYRLRSSDDFEMYDRQGIRSISPVDYRLQTLLQDLTRYQLDLSIQARKIATTLQKDVLASILYSEDDAKRDASYAIDLDLDFNKEEERARLISAYTQLSAIDAKNTKKINFHVDTIDSVISIIKNKENVKNLDFRSLEALRKTRKIIKMSLDAEEQNSLVFKPIHLFLSTIGGFILDKKFDFVHGELDITNSYGKIYPSSLSSGEKQLLILLIETLLQRGNPYIFLTDEPELSLHIAWQRKIIPAIKNINPNAQIIAATHSPEIASKFKGFIFDMEDIVHG